MVICSCKALPSQEVYEETSLQTYPGRLRIVSEHESKCTLSALHRRTQIDQLHGILLMPYTGHASCSRTSPWDEIAKSTKPETSKDLVFHCLNKKG